ncbi:MAG TPA: TetR/AcrR family transcriptional regulator [Streptosporangiaceae bacterium]|jgi:AcrR family transcriptional regulator
MKSKAAALSTAPGTGRGDTRARIQQVAVELFTEHGYDKTSLREIAERLDVTKAALYYHFKSKEDIVVSLVEDYYGQLDALIAWGRLQPRSAATRREVLRRYVSIVADGEAAFRMLHQNQAAVSSLSSAKGRSSLFRERLTALADLLAGPDAPVRERVRALMALGGVSFAWMFSADEAGDRAELRAAVLEAGCELAAARDGEPASTS